MSNLKPLGNKIWVQPLKLLYFTITFFRNFVYSTLKFLPKILVILPLVLEEYILGEPVKHQQPSC